MVVFGGTRSASPCKTMRPLLHSLPAVRHVLSRATVIFHPRGQSYFPLHPFLGERCQLSDDGFRGRVFFR